MSIVRFEGVRFKKTPRATSKRGPIFKKMDFPFFLAQGKNLTSMRIEIKKSP